MARATLAKDIMTRHVLTVSDDWSVEELARFLTEHAVSGAPVTNSGGELVGVVSVTDIARAAGEISAGRSEPATLYHHDYRLSDDELDSMIVEAHSQMLVKDVMTPMVFEVDASATVSSVAETMLRGRIHRVFVVERGKVVGVVSALDLLQLLVER